MTERSIELIKRAYNGVIPEVPQVYYEKVDYFTPMDTILELVPYVMMKLYTEDEMKMINVLPGSVQQIAEASGFEPEYVAERLGALAHLGKVMCTPDGGFARMPNNMTVMMDFYFFAIDSQGIELTEDLCNEIYLLRKAQINYRETPVEGAFKLPMRIVPKYESIKNIPGVMPCENIKEMLLGCQEKGALASMRCICKVLSSIWNDGSYPGPADENPLYMNEGDCAACGHCMQANFTGQYINGVMGGHLPSREEVLKKLDELNEANVMHVVSNTREPTTICNCNFDYCFPKDADAWNYIPSRFRPTRNESKCVKCGRCASICQFKAIDPETLAIDPDVCRGCGNCVTKCPEKALKMEIVRPTDWIPKEDIM